MSLLVLGTVALDNLKTPSGVRKDLLGGSATHFSMSARLFTKVHLSGIIGQDFPKKHINFLKKQGIDLTSLVQTSGKSFRWQGEYKQEDMNTAVTLATEIGVLGDYTPDVADKQKNIPDVFLANIGPREQEILLKKMGKSRLVGLDSMNLWIQNHRSDLLRLMKKVDLFVINDSEARMLSRKDNLIQAAKALGKMGPKWVVIKKGEHGVLFYCDQYMFSFPAYPVEKVIDPTGAGDTFAGGLMGYLSKSKTLNEKTFRKAIVYATILASFNVEGFGMAKTAPLTLQKINERMRKYLKFISH